MASLASPNLLAAAQALQAADSLLITAGAGMGVDSGLPDFRGNSGFWNAYPALGERGLQFQDMAHPKAFERDARQAWGFYGHRLKLYRDTQAHAGFDILKRWSALMPQGSFIFTSNVDGQFQRAGFAEKDVYECHGSIHNLQCTTPCEPRTWSSESLTPTVDTRTCQWLGDLPTCSQCQALARPHILMFGDWNWVDTQRERKDQALESFLSKTKQLVVIEIGAGTEVATVRSFSERIANTYQATLIRINPREPHCDLSGSMGLSMGALAALQALDALLHD
jgi:NAD-dependent SIR2 family protein deacetylase